MAQLLVDYDSPSFLKTFLESRGLAMQKKFGQNFLINRTAREKLLDALDIHAAAAPSEKKTTVWEVGPGLGAMTAGMLERGAEVTAFEIDRGFCSVLADIFPDNAPFPGKFSLISGNVLKTWKAEYEKNGAPDRFFGNLPYNIAAAIIADTITSGIRFEKAVVTVQKEVAQRMRAKPGSSDYSSFSVICQHAYNVLPVMELAGGSFWPRPNVSSAAVAMIRRDDYPHCEDEKHFQSVVRALFASRRKTVKNNFAAICGGADKAEHVLREAGVDPEMRAEKMTIEELAHLSDISRQYIRNRV